jgi:Zn-dependent M28 family amino/carboxypeptidase
MRTILFMEILFVFVGLIPAINAMVMNVDQAEHLKQSAAVDFSSSIQFNEVVAHLNALQNIATTTNGNRAVRTAGFNQTLDYITNYLAANTNLKVTKTFFNLRSFQLLRNPTLISTVNGIVTTHIYSTNLAAAEFYHAQYTTSVDISSDVLLTAIPDVGCSDADWLAANPPPAGLVALVKRGTCTFQEKVTLASKYNVAALLIYNDGSTSNNIQPIYINLGQNNRVPTLFLSYTLGQSLANAANNPLQTATVRLNILTDSAFNPVGNICADTLTGDPTQTIIVGSHSDSVTAGPGINDNGSGSAANLALATTLSRLLQTPDYAAYNYRVRFCWWGAEELGLLGADFHVTEAKQSTVVGERISDYLVNINLDMLGSPNFIFGIYEGSTAPANTPAAARPGSIKMTTLFQGWFNDNQLPWDPTGFDGRSDYGPFLAAGIAAGGLFSGADGVKSVATRNRYAALLGSSLAGTAGIRLDICYHQACDTTANINQFALEKMVQASAYAVESLGQQADLKSWLYPTKAIQQISKQLPQGQQFKYNSINEYFGLPYN